MKRILMSFVALAAVSVAGVSCLQLEQPALIENLSGDEIVFGADAYIEAETKASSGTTETTSLTSFYVSAVTGSAGSESSAFASTQFTKVTGSSPAMYKGAKMWPASNQSYKFYASNLALSYAAGGTTVSATNTTDVVCAYMTSPTYKTKNTLSFEHIFARLCDVTVTAKSGFTISNISVRITPKTGGTYNLRTGAGQTDGTGWSSVTTGSVTTVASATGSNSNDIYLVPGTYALTATWTATSDGTSKTYTNKVVNISVVGGKTNNVTLTLGGESPILFYVEIAPFTEVTHVDNLDYLTFYCDEAGTIGWKCTYASGAKTIQYSKDQGATWTSITSTTSGVTVSVSAGDIVWFKGSNSSYGTSFYDNCFTLTNKAHVYGNVNSLTGDNSSVGEYCFSYLFNGCGSNLYTYDAKKIILPATMLANSCYQGMFYGCTSLTTAPELPATTLAQRCYNSMFRVCTSLKHAPELPATTLASNCYYNMFYGCTSLKTAPELPATTLASDCYGSMFSGCTSLTLAPELPATTLASDCYTDMFYGCTSLTLAPELPATTLADACYFGMFSGCSSLMLAPELPATTLASDCYTNMFYGCTSLKIALELPATTLMDSCYSSMFSGCTSLTTAPELPATTLADACYFCMFEGCTSLTTAPELPATTLTDSCYSAMFYGCSSLKYIKALFTTTPSSSYTDNWVTGVAATGTFVKNSKATWNVSGINGVPTGWTVKTAVAPIGRFTVNANGDQVGFAPGNLQAHIASGPDGSEVYTADEWRFAEHQWDNCNAELASGNWVDHFAWVGASGKYDCYGLTTSTSSNRYGSVAEELKTPWGEIPGVVSVVGSGWRVLTGAEWDYVFNSRASRATVNDISNARYAQATINSDGTAVNGVILFPDGATFSAAEATFWGVINGSSYWGTRCTAAQWAALEAKGCVFLPAGGYRNGSSITTVGSSGFYWSSSLYSSNSRPYNVVFSSGSFNSQNNEYPRRYGLSVRLAK